MEDKSVLRWGGLAGMLGGIVFIFVPVILFGFVPPAPASPAELVARFPTVRAAIAAGNFVDVVSDALALALLLALYPALPGASPAPALFGSGLSGLGLAVIVTDMPTQVAFDPIAHLYHAP